MTTSSLYPRPDTASASPSAGAGDLASLVDSVLGGGLAGIFERMDWAEDEIKKARARHPKHSDRLYHSFLLLTPTHERMATEFVYRAHCRELIDRVAAGADTRPGTAAEVCCAMLEVTLRTPIRSAAFGLYLRMWHAAGFPDYPEFTEWRGHHEALEQTTIDDHELFARRKLAVADRHLGAIDCSGQHHGDDVNCVYAASQHKLAS